MSEITKKRIVWFYLNLLHNLIQEINTLFTMSTLIIDNLITLYNRDLNKLKKELELYNDESSLWKVDKAITNSGGNLCLHLIGNLKTYIGNGLCNSGYARNRDFEFSGKNVSRLKLYRELDETIAIVHLGLKSLTDEQIQGNFPINIWKEEAGMLFTLLHLHSHLNYHLGQINYHRRVLDV